MFRTYDCFADHHDVSGPLNPGQADSHQIWQVAMAIVAAPSYFNPARIDGQDFVDGFTAINPTQEALRDVKCSHHGTLSDTCVVSIGSGLLTKHSLWKKKIKDPKTVPAKNWNMIIDASRQYNTSTESTHRTVSDLLEQSEATYFRFNIGGVSDVRLDEWQKSETIAALTHQYLDDSGVQDALSHCASLLVRGLMKREGNSAKRCSSVIGSKKSVADKARPYMDLQTRNHEVYNTTFSLRGVPIAGKFIDRPSEMAKLEAAFFSSQDRRRKICVLSGLGGIGKTQLSVEFARRNSSRFSSIFWLNGLREYTLRQCIAAIAPMIPRDQDPVSSKMSALDETIDLDAAIEKFMN